MRKFSILIVLILTVFIVSCGEDSNYDGFYETTKYEKQENSCSGEFRPISYDDFEFFTLREESIMGTKFNEMYKCKSNDKSSCETEFGTMLDEYEEAQGYGNEKECVVGKVSYKIESISGGVRITRMHRSIKFTNIELKDCDTELMKGHEDELKCEKVFVREAKKL